ncbi:MAG: LCP family protein [Ruminococcus sp.]|uniref:LCP family protein n=1 Tax=Ruminococcus sp. TaxID=41978 RepID=UPI0025EAA2E9|nr:LCP family protein [Ruminococcus sp.]MCR5542006.1 LCP family protein [Ruminococcus sp.]
MKDKKEHTAASAELRDMINSRSDEADDDLKSSIAQAMDKKAASNKSADHSVDNDDKHSETNVKTEKKKHSRLNMRGGWSLRKKTGVTLGFIFLALVLLMAVIVFLFFHYTGLLKDRDNSIRTEKPPVDSRDLVDEPDTLDEKAKEKELREMLQQRSKKISNEKVMNILLIGEDIRDTATQDRGNTDVMMLISVNKEHKTVTLTSLMRDTWVYMEKFNISNKLNQAYWYGGAEYLSEVVEDYYSVKIDRTVKVNFQQFIDIAEVVGGLDFEVSYTEAVAMRDPMDEQNYYLHNPSGTDYVDLKQYGKDDSVNYYDVDGKFCTTIEYQSEEDNTIKMHLNGNQALAYARVRYGCGDDYGRTMRQREAITEIVSKAKKMNLIDLDALMNKVLPEVETDLEDGEIAEMLLNAFDYMNYDIQQLRLPVDDYFTMDFINSQSCLSLTTWQFQANAAMLRYMVYGDCKTVEEAREQYQKEIDDGTFYEKNDFQPPVYW